MSDQSIDKPSFFQSIEEILKDREEHYGKTEDCHESIAQMWEQYLEIKYGPVSITRIDVAIMMALFKICREAVKHKDDNLKDACAYLKFAHDFNQPKEEFKPRPCILCKNAINSLEEMLIEDGAYIHKKCVHEE